MSVQSLVDIKHLEQTPLSERNLAASTYEALRRAAVCNPQAPALSFFPDATHFTRTFEWNYSQLFAQITRAANAFHDLGIVPGEVLAFVLPNLPETHFTIWGAEAAGIVMAINPLQEAKQIASLLNSAKASVVVTLAPTPDNNLWAKLADQLNDLPGIRHIIWVSLEPYVSEPERDMLRSLAQRERAFHGNTVIHDLRELMEAQPETHLKSGRHIRPEEHSSCRPHPWLGSIQRLGHGRALTTSPEWPGDLLRPATLSCQWTTGHGTDALEPG